MFAFIENLTGSSSLYDLACIHNLNTIRKISHNTKVMCYQNNSCIRFFF